MITGLRPIPGFEGYFASEDGAVWSTRGRWTDGAPTRLAGTRRPDGYLQANCFRRPQLVHRLVCLAFHGEPPAGKPEVRHLDGTRDNNRPENLCWGSGSENARDTLRHGSHPSQKCPERQRRGEGVVTHKLTEDDVREIRRLFGARLSSAAMLAARFSVCEATIYKAVTREYWRHVEAP